MKSVIKIDQELFAVAQAKAKESRCSPTGQVEHWIELGQKADAEREESRLWLERAVARIDSREFSERANKIVFAKSGFVYGASASGPGLIDKVFPDGTRVAGKLVDGRFLTSSPA
jgi:hypothetical protein